METTSSRLPAAFKRLARSNFAAQTAEQLSLAAIPIVAVLSLGAGPGEIGFLSTAQSLPFLLLSLPLGVLADRTSRRRVMVFAETLRALALCAVVIAIIVDRVSIGLLAGLGFLGAVGTVAFSVAAPALIPALVPRAHLLLANGRFEVARSVAWAAGPALGGALVGWVGAAAALTLAAVLSTIAILFARGMEESARQSPGQQQVLRELLRGARFVWTEPTLRALLLTALVWNLSWFVLQAAYVPYAANALGLSAASIGSTMAALGVGMLFGATIAPEVVSRLPLGIALQIGPACSVLAAALMVCTLAIPSAFLAALAFALFGMGPTIWLITSTTLRQAASPKEMLSRVSAIFLTVNAGARPLGAAIGGAVGVTWGAPACLWLAFLGFAIQAAIIFLSGARTLQRLYPER